MISSHARAAAASRQVHAMTLPEGLVYVPGFLTEAGERDVLAVLPAAVAVGELEPPHPASTTKARLVTAPAMMTLRPVLVMFPPLTARDAANVTPAGRATTPYVLVRSLPVPRTMQ